ncbi:MAG: hypothetical protein IT285_02090 [Bdellovibrionales bacterium]|nr:hypothetical protein [Bdellovibrionales bacterium]
MTPSPGIRTLGRTLGLGLAFTFAAAAHSAAAGEDESVQAPFVCEQANGGAQACFGRVPAYPNEIAAIFPPGWERPASLEMVLYLHGNNASHRTLRRYLIDFRLPQALAASGRKAVMIVPLSRGPKTDQHEAAFGSGAGYRAVVTQLMAALKEAGLVEGGEPSRITLAGHSGAYRALSALVGQSVFLDRTLELLLLDAVYSPRESFVAFARQPGRRLWHVSTPGGGTLQDTACLQSRLQEAEVPFLGCIQYQEACGSNPVGEPSCLPPDTFTAAEWQGLRAGFLQDAVSHDEVVRKWLAPLLAGRAP